MLCLTTAIRLNGWTCSIMDNTLTTRLLVAPRWHHDHIVRYGSTVVAKTTVNAARRPALYIVVSGTTYVVEGVRFVYSRSGPRSSFFIGSRRMAVKKQSSLYNYFQEINGLWRPRSIRPVHRSIQLSHSDKRCLVSTVPGYKTTLNRATEIVLAISSASTLRSHQIPEKLCARRSRRF